jgi:hypothetical protein
MLQRAPPGFPQAPVSAPTYGPPLSGAMPPPVPMSAPLPFGVPPPVQQAAAMQGLAMHAPMLPRDPQPPSAPLLSVHPAFAPGSAPPAAPSAPPMSMPTPFTLPGAAAAAAGSASAGGPVLRPSSGAVVVVDASAAARLGVPRFTVRKFAAHTGYASGSPPLRPTVAQG